MIPSSIEHVSSFRRRCPPFCPRFFPDALHLFALSLQYFGICPLSPRSLLSKDGFEVKITKAKKSRQNRGQGGRAWSTRSQPAGDSGTIREFAIDCNTEEVRRCTDRKCCFRSGLASVLRRLTDWVMACRRFSGDPPERENGG